jgi:glycosyltransferase involved in cell wall biosynthesis
MDRTYADAARWQKRLIRLLLRGVDHFLVLSPYWQRHFARLAPRTPITVLPNAVRPLFLVEAREQRAAGAGAFTVLFVGEIGRRKGVHDLVEAVAIAHRSVPAIAVRLAGVAGEPAALNAVRRRVEALGLQDQVALVGPRYDEDLLHEYLEADVFVLPTYAEGQPVALIEAMATGACVIGTTIPPVASVVEDGIDGLLVAPGDVEALAAAMVQAAGDPALRARLGQAAMRTVRQRFTPERFLDDLDRFYQWLE